MSRSVSSRVLRNGLFAALVILALAAAAFYQSQNSSDRIGGAIALPKVFWLAYAIVLWLILPLAIALDRRGARIVRLAFGWLFTLMVSRGVIELWMLYVTLTWSPWYGIAHDLVCAIVLVACGWRAHARGIARSAPNGLLLAHLAVTAVAFIPEIYFAHYMIQFFATRGEHAIYFVPADDRYRDVLAWTTVVVLALSAYLPWFLWRWLVGTTRSTHTHPA